MKKTFTTTYPTSFVAFDVETANQHYESLCAIGITVVSEGELSETIHWLVRPHEDFAQFKNSGIHGIRATDVADQPDIATVWRTDIEPFFVESTTVISHNIQFDWGVLTRSLALYGLNVPELNKICTMQEGARRLPHLGKRPKLLDLAGHFGLEAGQHHHAGEDARICAEIGRRLLMLQPSDTDEGMDIQSAVRRAKDKAYFKGHQPEAQLENLIWDDVDAKATPDFFRGKKFVITGEFSRFGRDEVVQLLIEKGGTRQATVSSKTDFFIVGAEAGWSKVEKAKTLQQSGSSLQVLNEEELYQVLQAMKQREQESATLPGDDSTSTADVSNDTINQQVPELLKIEEIDRGSLTSFGLTFNRDYFSNKRIHIDGYLPDWDRVALEDTLETLGAKLFKSFTPTTNLLVLGIGHDRGKLTKAEVQFRKGQDLRAVDSKGLAAIMEKMRGWHGDWVTVANPTEESKNNAPAEAQPQQFKKPVQPNSTATAQKKSRGIWILIVVVILMLYLMFS